MSGETVSQDYIVIPFSRGARGRLVMGEKRQANSAAAAERVARAMAERFVGVVAYQVTVDRESGEISNARLLYQSGEIIDIMAEE